MSSSDEERTKKFLDDICRIVGHDLRERLENNTQIWAVTLDKACDRCGKEASGKVKWNELQVRRYDILDRMRNKVNEDFEKS